MPPAKGVPRAPSHLTDSSRRLWRKLIGDYDLADDDAALQLLRLALEAVDRCEQARAALAEHGTTYDDRFGCPKARPELAIERDSRLAAARLFRELALDGLDDADDSRPPD